ncbi:hypothetical protein SOVF_139680 isoform A [Spinacia oleracea]|nr:hypothetical protein SOVF_139680 isoform A [Spinacia oleracea]
MQFITLGGDCDFRNAVQSCSWFKEVKALFYKVDCIPPVAEPAQL